MYAHSAASGSSPNTASSAASAISLPDDDVTMSNQASQTSIVPVTAASGTSQRARKSPAHAVAANEHASATSKPTHARSYRVVM
jgi:hypothetical protein